MYDAIVVGARCAGSPTAMLLARKGYRVLLVDRASFPSDTISTHLIHPPGVVRLRCWGLLDTVLATGCPRIAKVTLHLGEAAFSQPSQSELESYAAADLFWVGPRRTVLDKILVDAAIAAGVELREGFHVRDLVMDDDRVTGIRGGSGHESAIVEHARIVIGADGVHSTIARKVHAPEYNTKPAVNFGYYTYWSGVPLNDFEFYMFDGGGVLGVPTNDGLSCIAVGGKRERFHEFRTDIESNYMRMLGRVPELLERVRSGRREARFVGTAEQPNYFRRPYGQGWALVGDSGYHRDFVTALGITDAFRDAELLADAIEKGFSGRRRLEEALSDYERRRNETVAPLYEFTYQLASGVVPDPAAFVAFGVAIQSMLPIWAAHE